SGIRSQSCVHFIPSDLHVRHLFGQFNGKPIIRNQLTPNHAATTAGVVPEFSLSSLRALKIFAGCKQESNHRLGIDNFGSPCFFGHGSAPRWRVGLTRRRIRGYREPPLIHAMSGRAMLANTEAAYPSAKNATRGRSHTKWHPWHPYYGA